MSSEELEDSSRLDLYLGQDFLTWLWYNSEVRQGQLSTSGGEVFFLAMEQRIAVEGGAGQSRDIAVSSGPGTSLREAKLGLQSGKKVNRALMRIELDSEAWRLQLKAEDFSVSGMKTPRVQKAREEGEDPDAPLLEKVYLIEKCLELVDDLFAQFLRLRFSQEWSEEARKIGDWIRNL